jgi:hypothetical protein
MLNAGNGVWFADRSAFSKNNFIASGNLNTVNGILEGNACHSSVSQGSAYQQEEMLGEKHI